MKRTPYYPLIAAALLGLVAVSCSKSLQLNPAHSLRASVQTMSAGTSVRLTVSKKTNLGTPYVQLAPDSVYTSLTFADGLFTPLPSGYAGHIVSFSLPQGYMAVFAQHNDGTGTSVCYVAVDSAIHGNLPSNLQNKVNFVRFSPVNNPDKKGTASTNDTAVWALATSWFYGWSLNRSSFPGQQFVPMTWGKGSCTDPNVSYLVDRTDIDHLLSFNEPDNTSQSNIPNIDTAITRYSIMAKTGLRLGAPATQQGHVIPAGSWEYNFMQAAASFPVRVDYIPLHWYDWGNQTNNQATDSLTAQAVFNRFQTYVQNVHAAYPNQTIWITEFNANPNRTSLVVQEYFMYLASTWMNNTPYVERYSFFFPSIFPPTQSDGSLTAIGQYWHDLTSTKAFSSNVVAPGTTLF